MCKYAHNSHDRYSAIHTYIGFPAVIAKLVTKQRRWLWHDPSIQLQVVALRAVARRARVALRAPSIQLPRRTWLTKLSLGAFSQGCHHLCQCLPCSLQGASSHGCALRVAHQRHQRARPNKEEAGPNKEEAGRRQCKPTAQ